MNRPGAPPGTRRGQQYCAAGCSGLARRESLRAAGRRYQHSRRGRHCHAERQRRYRHRRREGACREKVTHQGSAAPPSGAPLTRQRVLRREASPSRCSPAGAADSTAKPRPLFARSPGPVAPARRPVVWSPFVAARPCGRSTTCDGICLGLPRTLRKLCEACPWPMPTPDARRKTSLRVRGTRVYGTSDMSLRVRYSRRHRREQTR